MTRFKQTGNHHGQKTKASMKQSEPSGCWGSMSPGPEASAGFIGAEANAAVTLSRAKAGERINRIESRLKPIAKGRGSNRIGGGVQLGLTDGRTGGLQRADELVEPVRRRNSASRLL